MKDLGPILVGLCGAAVIIGARWVLRRVLARELNRNPHRRTKHAAFFGFMAVLTAAGALFLRDDLLLRMGLAAMSFFFLWACLGSVFGWPGFRDA